MNTITTVQSFSLYKLPTYRTRSRGNSYNFQQTRLLEKSSSRREYSDNIIEEVKKEADIISVIESYNLPQFTRLSVDRATAICPFHDDKNPSLNIDNNKGLYKCFSCGAGGDIFNFVREYDYLSKGKTKKMSFPEAVIKVANEFCSKKVQEQVARLFQSNRSSAERRMSPEQRKKLEMERKKKERILLANSVAADFYAKSLITSPAAGSARSHLFERGVAPGLVRTFALGYAPDSYFTVEQQKDSNSKSRFDNWGKGSLVERLAEMNFEPKEIVEAGLATVTSAAKNRLSAIRYRSSIVDDGDKTDTHGSTNTNDKKQSRKKEGELQYSDLIDRFRGRLIIPIFDSCGKNIVGFGGRDLDEGKIHKSKEIENATKETKKQTFKSPKYLNSPESLVFDKKTLLFGLNSAHAALQNCKKTSEEGNISKDDEPSLPTVLDKKPSLVIVEGYFDVISLYGAGVLKAVASMGAALTSQQLEKVADTLGQGMNIFLC